VSLTKVLNEKKVPTIIPKEQIIRTKLRFESIIDIEFIK
jgi:hypothetical protein